ncbi:MAG: large repetitive protein [Chthoniobacter sp.]|jgi:hypothetical protein|nr:large repetitive protein [Chthoniobacter sp.]
MYSYNPTVIRPPAGTPRQPTIAARSGRPASLLSWLSKATILIVFVSFFLCGLVHAGPFTAGNLVVAQAANANNTTVSIVELSPTALNQNPTNTIAIDGASANGLRVSGSASSTLYLGRTNDGALLCFTGHNTTTTTGNINVILPRGVGTLNPSGNYLLQTTYTGNSGSQTRSATSLNNSTWFVGDQGGVYTNGSTTPSPAGNFRSLKAFGGTVYLFQAATTTPTVSVVSAVSGGTVTGLPGLPNGTASAQDFQLISSGDNGAAFDVLYVLSATSATAGTIEKYSLVGGSWVANGSYVTAFGGFGIVAADNANMADLYVTTGTGATVANNVLHLTDTAGFNSTINITTASNQTLYTAPAGFLAKGISFAPVATTGNADLSSLTLSAGTLTPAFAAATPTYTATVPSASASITVTPSAADPTATVEARVNGASYSQVTSGSPSGALALIVGANTVDIKVAKGTAVKVYTITVTRPPSSDANLTSLSLSAGTISPVFAAATNSYSASVGNATSTVTVTPTAADATSTLLARVNGGTYTPVTSGSATGALTLNEGDNTIDIQVTAQDGTTIKTYTVTVGRMPSSFNSTARDIYEQNRGTWNAAGINVGSTQFINLGLQGVGRVPANAIDPATGESLGSVSDMQVTNFVNNHNGTWSGIFNFLPDRGYNSGAIFSNYAARINTFTFTFTPYTLAATTTAQDQVAMTFTGSTRFTYDHDGNPNTLPVFTTGLLADTSTTLFGTTVPAASGASVQSDGPVNNRLTIDAEGLVFDSRAGKSGTGWIGDEYGAYIYHFNSAKQIDGQLRMPDALIPHSPVGTINYLIDPALNGRRVNQGVEGLSQTPDGRKLFGLMQSATIQDSGAGNQGRSNTRLLVYDLTASDTPSDPVAQYLIQLPRVDDTGSTTNGTTVNRNAAQSSILALNDHQILILSRDGNGRGASGAPVFKSILLADLATATNFDGTYDAEGAAVAPAGVLNVNVAPLTWREALNLIGKLDLGIAEVAKFGLNLNAAPGDINTICEKWEALGLVSVGDPITPDDYFLFVGNDNDFLTTTGKYLDANNQIQSYNAGLENDTLVLAYRVRIVSTTNYRFAQSALSVQEDAGGVTLTLTRDGDTSAAATVNVTTTDGTAISGTDYSGVTNQAVTFSAGSPTATINVIVANRAGVRADRTFTASVSTPDFGTIGTPATTTVTITEAEAGFAFAAATASVREDAGKVTLTINRTGKTGAATVNISTADGTAVAGKDYTALTSVPVAFGAGVAQKTVDINVTNRPGIRVARTFAAMLAPGVGVVLITPSSATVTITEADLEGTLTGPSSSATPYVQPFDNGWQTTAVLTVGDTVPRTGTTTGETYAMVGIPDGLGAYDNGNGTLTLLMNHELGNTVGGIRAHGSIGAFVSEWIIDKSTLQVISGSDLMQSIFGWNTATQSSLNSPATVAFNRFCSADLPPVGAFYNPVSGLGTQNRIFMDGEEGGATGYALAHVATGPDKGKTFVLGKFNLSTNGSGLTGVGAWENILANPFVQNKTVVVATNDGGTGIMTNTVSVYVGLKTSSGTDADKAGLTNGTLKFVNVVGNAAEISDASTRTTNILSGTRFSLGASTSTLFSRPEDGAWNPLNPKQFYFVTTDRLDQVADSVGAQIGRTRLWRLTFDDIMNPETGGVIDLLLTGGVGNDANMWDNMAVTAEGEILLQEDVGAAAHNGKVWLYNPLAGSLRKVLKHDAARFGEITNGVAAPATAPFTNDEETSGIIDVTTLFGGNAATGEHYFFTADQAHYPQPGALVEGGQLLLIHQVATQTGISSTSTPYVVPMDPAFQTTSVLTVGDTVPKTGTTSGETYAMVGIPDGLGAYDNGDGTLTLLMNHELGNNVGGMRAHGSIGAFVSEWIINKNTLRVVSGSDLMRSIFGWNTGTQSSNTVAATVAFNRFCSADLPPVSAFYNPASGLGTQNRIFMDGEEGGTTGYALAHVATGPDKGKTYVLGKFNLSTNGSGLTGVGAWENILANPFVQDKTVVVATNDGGTGIMTNSVSVYVGTKTNSGTDADKAGLNNGTLKFVNVAGNPVEITDPTTRSTGITNGTSFSLSATASTMFSRPEDGAWNPLNPAQFYFVTTDRLDQVPDGVGTQIGRTRLWRLTFADLTNPDAGGVIDLLLTGGMGNDANMWDNLVVNSAGLILLQEDVGGAAHNGKVWQFNPATGSLRKVLKHDVARFGEVTSGGVIVTATAPFTNDEETSGIIDVTDIFGGNAAAGEHVYFTSDQAHFPQAGALVEGGQLALVRETPAIAFSFSDSITSVGESEGSVTLTVKRYGDLQFAAGVSVSTANGSATAPADYTALNAQLVNFAPGQLQATVNVAIANRAGVQGDRTFTAQLTNPANGGVLATPALATITIHEGNSSYRIENATYSLLENAGPLQINLTRTGSTAAADATLTATDGTAHAGTDYTAPASTVHFGAGQMSATVSIPITNLSGTPQGTRSFTLALTAVPGGSVIAGTPATVTITEAEGSGGLLSFDNASIRLNPVNELRQPNTVAVVINRTDTAQGAVSVTVTASQPGSVPAGQKKLDGTTDYTLAGDTAMVAFADGEAEKTLSIPLKATVRPGQFLLTLSAPTGGASLGTPAQATVEVTKKDTSGPLLFIGLGAPDANGMTTLTGFAQDTKSPAAGIHHVSYSVSNIAGTSNPVNLALVFGAFSQSVQLEQGANTVTVMAVDNGGNVTTEIAKVSYSDPDMTALAGNYRGLLVPTGTPSNETSGLLTVTVTGSATVTGKLQTGGDTTSFKGALDSAGNVHFKPTNGTALPAGAASLSVNIIGGQATGTLTVAGGGGAVAVAARETSANAGLLNGGAAQKFTLVFPSKAQPVLKPAQVPQGDGYATITVNPNGMFTAAGSLADGTDFTAGGWLTTAGANSQPGPLYVSLPKAAGSLATALVFDLSAATRANSDVLGNDSLWIHPAVQGSRYYPDGWPAGIRMDALGARFTVPAAASILPGLGTTSPNAQLQFTDGKLATSLLLRDLDLSKTNVFTNRSTDPALTLKMTTATGVFQGVFTHTDTKKTDYRGVVLQEGTNAKGFGYFLSTPPAGNSGAESGGVVLLPRP